MKRPTFMQGVVVAAILSFVAAALFALLGTILAAGSIFQLLIPGLGLAYICVLMRSSGIRTGNLTTLALWATMTVAAAWAAPSLPVYALVHVGAIWLVRSLYFYAGAIPSLMDLGLSALGVAGFTWAFGETGSVLLGTWTFFLVNAVSAVIPTSVGKARDTAGTDNRAFDHARRRAEAALAALSRR